MVIIGRDGSDWNACIGHYAPIMDSAVGKCGFKVNGAPMGSFFCYYASCFGKDIKSYKILLAN